MEGGGAVDSKKKMPHHPFVEQDPGPLESSEAHEQGNQTPQNWFKIYHPP